MKECSNCHAILETSEYYRHNKAIDGLSSHCKKCHAVYTKDWKANNVEAKRRHKKLWARRNKEKSMLASARRRAKKKGVVFNISLKDISIPKYCPILGFELLREGGIQYNSPSLDRIEPHLGYIPENIQVISFRANTLKNSSTKEEIKKLWEWAEKNL